jgi:hypothetical protein
MNFQTLSICLHRAWSQTSVYTVHIVHDTGSLSITLHYFLSNSALSVSSPVLLFDITVPSSWYFSDYCAPPTANGLRLRRCGRSALSKIKDTLEYISTYCIAQHMYIVQDSYITTK